MSTPAPVQQDNPMRMILVMGSVGLISSLLLVYTYRTTAPYIEANRAAYLQQSVFAVLPGAVQKRTFVPADGQDLAASEDENPQGERYFAGYDADGNLIGIAIEAQGQGYADVIRLLYGYDPACACVIGMKVLESKETPGLGDKIDKDPSFLSNFERLSVALTEDMTGLLRRLELVKPGAREEDWQVAAITGATISSRAVTEIIDRSSERVLPRLHANLDHLRNAP